MREATIICPDHAAALEYAKGQAIDWFGGVTVTHGEGAWRDDAGKVIAEPVHILAIACEETITNYGLLDTLADRIGKLACQQCVYIRYPNGRVTLRATAHLWQKAADAA